MTDPGEERPQDHPWEGIDLAIYENHMSDAAVGQLQLLHQITGEQLTTYPSRSIGILGVAGGNGLDLIDPATTDAVFGYDINGQYLQACADRHNATLGPRLHLVQASIDRALDIAPVGLLIANLIVEYVGIEEFAAFAAANIHAIGTLSCVTQLNEATGFVSPTQYAASFDGLGAISSDIDPLALVTAMGKAGFAHVLSLSYPLHNGKTLVRQDFRPHTTRTTTKGK
ncbi:hypothetical protein [Pseudarthrobacter sp. H2]|uniref:hypothetical protein n=1 Tax=Pseudarthrobacter sp. H2 TaxID=3418415 RepID=UPI003CF8BD78